MEEKSLNFRSTDVQNADWLFENLSEANKALIIAATNTMLALFMNIQQTQMTNFQREEQKEV